MTDEAYHWLMLFGALMAPLLSGAVMWGGFKVTMKTRAHDIEDLRMTIKEGFQQVGAKFERHDERIADVETETRVLQEQLKIVLDRSE